MEHRFRDWQSRLEAFIEERRYRPFEWGSNDCCIFACDAIKIQTGHDPAKELRTYTSASGATSVLKANGGVESLADQRLGKSIHPLQAAIGDIGLVQSKGRDTLAICGGDHWVGPSESGLIRVPIDQATRAWRCDRANSSS